MADDGPRPARPADGIAWITGASSGIGRELARRLLDEGWTVALTARREAELQALAHRYPADRALVIAADVTDAAAMAADLAALGNDLEAPAIALCPAIAGALATIARLPGVLLARMSGSGATCFGLFASPEAAIAAAAAAQLPRGWWSWGGGLAEARSGTGHASGR